MKLENKEDHDPFKYIDPMLSKDIELILAICDVRVEEFEALVEAKFYQFKKITTKLMQNGKSQINKFT